MLSNFPHGIICKFRGPLPLTGSYAWTRCGKKEYLVNFRPPTLAHQWPQSFHRLNRRFTMDTCAEYRFAAHSQSSRAKAFVRPEKTAHPKNDILVSAAYLDEWTSDRAASTS